MTTKRILAILSTLLVIGVLSLHSKAIRIMSDQLRNDYIQDLQTLLNYEDEELRASIPYVVNPFFFEQPLLLKLRAPGGVKDMDLLKAIGDTLVAEISGAFVRGSRRSLLMKNGELIKEGDSITKKVANFGGLETTVTIESIDRDKFVLKLNESVITVDLTGNE
jgi:hypothetical protein